MQIVFMFTGKMLVFLAKTCHGKQMMQNTQQRTTKKTYSSKEVISDYLAFSVCP